MTHKKKLHHFNESFEREVFEAVKHYGFKFPESEEDIEMYVRLFGSTEIELPDSLIDAGSVFDSVRGVEHSDKDRDVWACAAQGENGDHLPKYVLDKIKKDISKGNWVKRELNENKQTGRN